MTITDEQIRQHLRLGEDSSCEFKQVEFKGNRPKSPDRDTIADEMIAFANADGGLILCGVTDDSEIQGLSREQMDALDSQLTEVSTDSVKPPLRVSVHRKELDGKALLVVEVPRGDTVYERSGQAHIRVGGTKRKLEGDERMRLAQNRAQSRFLWHDEQAVPGTGFETLSERLWEPLLSVSGADDPRRALRNIRLLTQDESGVDRATVAGVLLCTESPHELLPQATISATRYRGKDRDSEQLDAKEITGPLPVQISESVKFVVSNMRIGARKAPAREDLPEYNPVAVFEAMVNAVVHRDYSMHGRRIRISMFMDRLEIDSPGMLPNSMTIDGMEESQATRNEVIASAFARIPVNNTLGSEHRRYLMERRGDGVSIIRKQTQEATGIAPTYKLVDGSNLVLAIPAARPVLVPSDATVTIHAQGEPLANVEVLALFPNKTWQRAITDDAGEAILNLYTINLPMTVYAAAQGYTAGLKRSWLPSAGGVLLELSPLEAGGSAIFTKSTGHLPGLSGRLNPKLDTSDRTYLYADNIAIEDGRQQPVTFRLGKPFKLTDAFGVNLMVTIVDIMGRSSLLEYRSLNN